MDSTANGAITDVDVNFLKIIRKKKPGIKELENCHEGSRNLDHIEKVLFDAEGVVVDEDDSCRYCGKPITIDQK